MPAEPSEADVAFAGQKVNQKTLLALALSAVIPLLLLTYVLHAHIGPRLDPAGRSAVLWVQVLIGWTGLLMSAGGYVIWDLAGAVTQTARIVGEGKLGHAFGKRSDEVGAIMQSFSEMLATIERQAQEIHESAAQLDGAYRELESANVRLKQLSFKDEVTGLYNRRFFSVRLDEEVSRLHRFGHPLSLVLLDLDNFKTVNDQLGHAVGDATLRDIAEILLKQSRSINVISRYGGDEFAVLLVETPKAGARLYAERIRAVIARYPFSHGCPVTASFGIASLPEDVPASSEALMGAADEALYAAKRAGKNTVVAYGHEPAEAVVQAGGKVG